MRIVWVATIVSATSIAARDGRSRRSLGSGIVRPNFMQVRYDNTPCRFEPI